jgi:hypothetical protein
MASLAAATKNENELVYFLSHYQAEGGTVALGFGVLCVIFGMIGIYLIWGDPSPGAPGTTRRKLLDLHGHNL